MIFQYFLYPRVTFARACSDGISDLAPFRHDPRPTWLFLSSGVPAALMRGANRLVQVHTKTQIQFLSRPLLTKLFLSELSLERSLPRAAVDIDFNSGSVIQCGGDLAGLDADTTVHSIGRA